jgi:hypothetical protein
MDLLPAVIWCVLREIFFRVSWDPFDTSTHIERPLDQGCQGRGIQSERGVVDQVFVVRRLGLSPR